MSQEDGVDTADIGTGRRLGGQVKNTADKSETWWISQNLEDRSETRRSGEIRVDKSRT